LWWWPKDETAKWRTAAAMFISSIVLFQPFLDQQLAKLWTYLATSPNMIATAFRHDHWEWMLAVAAFACYIHFYWLADRAVLKAGENGRVHPWRKFRLQDRLEAQNHHRNRLVQSENGIDVNLNEQPPLVTPQSPWNRKGWIFELWVYVVPLFVLDRLYPRRALRLSMFGPPTAFTICRDVSCGLLLYDFFFFCGHVLMHRLPFLWGIHKKHHEVLEVRAGDVVRLSLAEEVLEVLMSVVALTLLKAHPISRSIYNCIIVFLLTELHSGFDFPWSPQNVVPFGLATGSRRHHYHHRYGTHYYQKFFHSFDRLFGFFQPNDGSIRGDSVLPVKKLPSSWATANS
jgi:sterol desaturase/sphingolipid hydroxylase (fatty acid hydroxylase superfamily)